MTQDAYIVDAVRTPVGRHGGALAGVRPDDLAAVPLRALLDRNPALDPVSVDEVYLGDANGAGEDNRNVARMATLLAGFPVTVPGATVNRLCGSGMEAVIDGSRAVAVGDAEVVVAGGVESMTRAPWVVLKPAKGYPTAHEQLWNTTLGWRMVNPRMPAEWTISLGEGAEVLAEKYSLSRDAQDEFALASHRKAAAAWEAGDFAAEVVAVPGVALEQDESIRADTTAEKLAGLKPAFRSGGTVTAGNSSPLNDGAAALLLMSERAAASAGAPPLARVAARATSGVEPHLYGIGPVEAARDRAASCRHRLRRPGGGGAERGLRGAEPVVPGRVARPRSGHREPAGRRHRHRAPPGLQRRPHPHHPRAPPPAHGWPLGPGGHVHRRRAGHRRRRREHALTGRPG